MKRLVVGILSLLVLFGLIGWRLMQKRQETAAMASQGAARAKAAPQVAVGQAAVRELVSVFEGTGNLEAPLDVKIAAKVSGRIEFLTVNEGDAVHRGQVLVRINAAQIEAGVRQAEAALSEANYRLAQALVTQKPTNVGVQTQVKQQQAAVASARADYEQVRQNLASQIAAAQAVVSDVQARLDKAQADIDNANSNINAVRATLNNANTRLNRVADLYKQGYIAAQDVDDARAAAKVQEAQLATAEGQLRAAQAARGSVLAQKQSAEEQVRIVKTKGAADVEAAHQKLLQAQAALEYAHANTAQSPAYKEGLAALRAAVASAKAQVASAKAQYADTVLTSPINGFVTARLADPGSMATPGQALLGIQYFREIWLKVPVPAPVTTQVRPGQQFAVTLDALPGQTLTATVLKLNPSADPTARQFTVRASLDNSSGLLKPGMFANVKIETERVKGLTVPREAVQRGEEGTYVNLVTADDKVQRQPVKTGASDASYIAITSGLQAGDRVVTICAVPLRDGQEVKLGEKPAAGGGGRGERDGGPASKPGAPAATAPAGRPAQ